MKDSKKVLENTIKRCRERDIIIPTYEEMAHPDKIPQGIKDELKNVGLWDLHSRNLSGSHGRMKRLNLEVALER